MQIRKFRLLSPEGSLAYNLTETSNRHISPYEQNKTTPSEYLKYTREFKVHAGRDKVSDFFFETSVISLRRARDDFLSVRR